MQTKLFDFIVAYVETHDFAPTFEEMADHLGIASKNGVHRLVTGLEERGRIRRLRHRARAIEIVGQGG
ncbi:hypothetical protein [Hansschlegelia sp.]|uniref:LexA family protein n=1 Tax=Hansschlegelia sp. TaxID=2041892 RepID=UPI0039C85A2E